MARSFHDAIIKGEIDNRQPGRVSGRLWLVGQDGPVKLHLQGNCAPDVAGCLLEFFNPEPMPQDIAPLHRLQTGKVLASTASERLQDANGQVSNGLHMSWVSDQDGTVIIESTRYKLRVFDREWSERERTPPRPASLTGHSEFAWQAFLKLPDNVGRDHLASFSRFLEEGHERRTEDTDYLHIPALHDVWDEDGFLPDIEPNPETEGIDWVRDDVGDVHHPFTLVSRQFAMTIWQYCHSLDLFEAPDDPDIRALVDQVEQFSARAGNALDDLAYDERPDYAYMVANLKHALGSLHEAMNAMYRVRQKRALAARSDQFSRQMFVLRERIIELMTDFRRREG